MKVKIKLSKNEFKAFYMVLSELLPIIRKMDIDQDWLLRLETLAVREIMTSFYMKMTTKIDSIEAQKTISFAIKMQEAWAINHSLGSTIELLDDYSMAVCLKIIGEINRRTV